MPSAVSRSRALSTVFLLQKVCDQANTRAYSPNLALSFFPHFRSSGLSHKCYQSKIVKVLERLCGSFGTLIFAQHRKTR